MSLTMIIGAFIGGATSEGGGAVAFPVMTLALALEPRVARDFVYVSQSTGNLSNKAQWLSKERNLAFKSPQQ